MDTNTWTRSREADEFDIERITYRLELANGESIVIARDGIPSWPYTLTWPGGDTFVSTTLAIAKAEAEDYARRLAA